MLKFPSTGKNFIHHILQSGEESVDIFSNNIKSKYKTHKWMITFPI